MNSHLQYIIEKCREKLPHLYLSEHKGPDHIYRKVYRDITLQDILLCLGDEYAIDGDGYFLKDNERSSDWNTIIKPYIVGPTVRYNMNLSPYDQEESVLEFISKNI